MIHTFGPQSTVGQPIIVANEIAFAAAAGEITGLVPLHKFGHNPASGNGTEDDIWAQGGNLTWLTAAAQMDVVSTSTDDDGDPTTNTGAQTIRIEYLDSSFAEQTEDVTLDGTTIATTVASMLRINRAYVLTSGTYHGTNLGTITIRVTGGGAIQANIPVGIGQTQKSHFTIPAGMTGYFVRLSVDLDASKAGDFSFYQYQNADDITQPFGGCRRIVHHVPGVAGNHAEIFRAFPAFPEKTDLWWTCKANAASTNVAVDYDLACVAN
jgi:hypothetical protein